MWECESLRFEVLRFWEEKIVCDDVVVVVDKWDKVIKWGREEERGEEMKDKLFLVSEIS